MFFKIHPVTRFFVCSFMLLPFFNCNDTSEYKSPSGYNLNNPKKFVVSEDLREISGIAFSKTSKDSIYAIEDESGKVYSFQLGEKKYRTTKFYKKGDYEDIAIMNNNTAAILRSDGFIITFPLDDQNEKSDSVLEHKNILPKGEYEGLFADEDNSLVVICKKCDEDGKDKKLSLYMLQQNNDKQITVAGNLKIDLSPVAKKKGKFQPSCIAKHPLTNEWYIISSASKALLILNEEWKVKDYYLLDPSIFRQPEGLAFDAKGNMYVSNEGKLGKPNILLFSYKQL